MNAELLTALVRATNDGVIPAPYPGEDTHDYRLRCALSGASVTLAYLREVTERSREAVEPNIPQEGRPSDVTVTSPPSPDNPLTFHNVFGPNGQSRDDEVGVD